MQADRAPVLIADIGGTNARFALAGIGRTPPLLADSIRHYVVDDFATAHAAIAHYLRETGVKPRRAALAIAGRIKDGQVRATNSHWRIVATELRSKLDLEHIRLLNDFAAQSMCLPLLGVDDIRQVGTLPAPEVGADDAQTFAVIGPGTGLGVGALLLRDGRLLPLETEGGHCSFAPQTDEEIEILKVLTARFGHVSNERLVCADGLANLHQALAVIDGTPADALQPEQITEHAQRGNDGLCVRTVEMACAIFGAVAGDAVLGLGGWDGAYLAGGLSPVLLPWLQQGAFRRRFEDKGRYAAAMRKVPTVAITHPQAGLLGAAASAVVDAGGSLLRGASTERPTV